jgi:D-alanyl-D-alanine carboxypeptidase/D-alanyl-D-alanine-endopeptidase (penicillin-binding protein 4)
VPESDGSHSESPSERPAAGPGPDAEPEQPKEPEQPDAPEAPDEGVEVEEQADGDPRSGRRLRRVTAGAVALLLVAALAAYAFDLGPRWFGFDYPSPVTHPALVEPPPGLTLPSARPAAAVATPTPDRDADPAAVRRALTRLVHERRLGRHVAVDVSDLEDGASVYRYGAGLVTPASTMKLLTSTAALATLGPEHRFRTTVVARPGSRTITLVGGGDPLLAREPADLDEEYPARADLQTLARSTAKALKGLGRAKVRLRYDASLFTGPAVSPHWPPSYIPDDVVSPISALWVDEGRDPSGTGARSADPARAAAEAFARALRQRHVRVAGPPVARTAPDDADELAAVSSAPLAQIVQHVLEVSDNEGAEVLARQTAVATDRPASFAGGAAAVTRELGDLGIDLDGARIHDGSGLSRQDRLRPETLLQVVGTAADPDHPDLRPVVADLPVAGFTGSLSYRFQTGDPAGPGAVRAKTGTLTGVHGLAGTVTTRDGVLLAFVAVADRVKVPDTLAARATLDRIAAALAGCACAATP